METVLKTETEAEAIEPKSKTIAHTYIIDVWGYTEILPNKISH